MKYHPDIELLLKYSSGQLDPALTIAIAIHQYHCEICQQKIKDFESIGGSALESLMADSTNISNISQKPNDDMLNDFDKLLIDIEHLPVTKNDEHSFLPVAEYDFEIFSLLYNRQFDNFQWKKVTRNISKTTIALNDPHFEVELLKFSANAKIPKHTHCGKEFTLVLEGDFSDHNDQYNSGEFIEKNQQHEHQPIAGVNGCICMAITNAPLKFTGTLGPVINWLNHRM